MAIAATWDRLPHSCAIPVKTATWTATALRSGRPAAGLLLWSANHLHQVQVPDRLLLEALHHVFEHVERLALVLHQGIVLTVPAQPDSLAQVIHIEQMIFPVLIQHAQHDHALVIAHRVRTNQFLFRVVTLAQLVENRVAQFLPVQRLRLQALRRDIHAESREDRVFHALDIPVFRMHFLGRVLIQQAGQNVGNVILENQVLLIHTFEQLTPQSIDSLALLVHHVVVFEQVFAGFEVLRFHGLLRCFYPARDQLRLDRHALFHAQPLKERAHPLFREDAHQVVFKREIKTR